VTPPQIISSFFSSLVTAKIVKGSNHYYFPSITKQQTTIKKQSLRMYFTHSQLEAMPIFGSVISLA
jgi:hypothetical protein